LAINEKLDGIYKLLTQWNVNTEVGSAQLSQWPITDSPTSAPLIILIADEIPFLIVQEAANILLIQASIPTIELFTTEAPTPVFDSLSIALPQHITKPLRPHSLPTNPIHT
jgi:hypothetical protein